MKKYFTELTDVDGNKHVADLQDKDNFINAYTSEAPTTLSEADMAIFNLKWVKVQDNQWLSLAHVKSFKSVEKES